MSVKLIFRAINNAVLGSNCECLAKDVEGMRLSDAHR